MCDPKDHLCNLNRVFISGCFDFVDSLHSGHLAILKKAKSLGDYLMIALNDDDYIRQNKGPNRPIQCLEKRIEAIRNTGLANCIISFNNNGQLFDIIKGFKPKTIVVGNDYSIDKVVGYPKCLDWGGNVFIMDRIKDEKGIDISTTNILRENNN